MKACMRNLMKGIQGKAAIASAFVIAVFVLSSCRANVVVIPGPHCYREGFQVCSVYRDYWGRPHRECHIEYRNRCVATQSVLGVALGPVALADKFGISVSAADQLIDALIEAKQGNYDAFMKLGFDASDLMKLGNLEMPSDAGIDSVARILDQSPDSIRNMLTEIIRENKKVSEIADQLVLTN